MDHREINERLDRLTKIYDELDELDTAFYVDAIDGGRQQAVSSEEIIKLFTAALTSLTRLRAILRDRRDALIQEDVKHGT